jgi:hypothetical protein
MKTVNGSRSPNGANARDGRRSPGEFDDALLSRHVAAVLMMKTLLVRFGCVAAWVGGGLILAGCKSDPETSRQESAVHTTYTRLPAVSAPASPGAVTVVPPAAPVATSPAAATIVAAPSPAPDSAPAEAPAPAGETNDVAVAAVPAQRPPLPTVVNEILDLSAAAVGDQVLLEYVKKAQVAYELSADDVLYLKDVGLSDDVIAAIVRRGNELREQGAPRAAVQATTAPPPPVTATAEAAPNPPPQTVTQVPPPAQPATVTQPVSEAYSYWYSTLSPYGSWVYLPSYGWCWQPAVARTVPEWRPYAHNGAWVWTSSGWYWNSYYTWGWGPFHYGRWYLSPACGWVWVPGSVWAPAWVTWRYCDTYWGWAPLPPAASWTTGVGLTWYGSGASVSFGFNLGWIWYTYVPPAYFCHPHPYRYCPPRQQVVNIHNTTIINNVTYNNGTIVNGGIPPQRYTELTRKEVPRATLTETATPVRTPPVASGGRGNREAQLAVYRPTIPEQPGFARSRVDVVPAAATSPSRSSQEITRSNPAFAPGAAVPVRRSPERAGAPAQVERPSSAAVGRSGPVVVPVRSRPVQTPHPARASAPSPRPGEVVPVNRGPDAAVGRNATPPSRVETATPPTARGSVSASGPQQAVVPQRGAGASGRADGPVAAPVRSAPNATIPARPAVPSDRGVPSADPSREAPGIAPPPGSVTPQRTIPSAEGAAPAGRSALYQAPVTAPSRGEVARTPGASAPGAVAPKFSTPGVAAPGQPGRVSGLGQVPPSAVPSRSSAAPSFNAPQPTVRPGSVPSYSAPVSGPPARPAPAPSFNAPAPGGRLSGPPGMNAAPVRSAPAVQPPAGATPAPVSGGRGSPTPQPN